MHDAAPGEDQEPSAQLWHVPLNTELKRPAAHGTQFAYRLGLSLPGGHGRQAAPALNQFAPHGTEEGVGERDGVGVAEGDAPAERELVGVLV